jgi:hypothetical protein
MKTIGSGDRWLLSVAADTVLLRSAAARRAVKAFGPNWLCGKIFWQLKAHGLM